MINAVCYNVTGGVVDCASVAMPTNDTDYCNNVLMEVCPYNVMMYQFLLAVTMVAGVSYH